MSPTDKLTQDVIAGDPETGRAVTHSENCWKYPGHHACAVRKVDEQADKVDKQAAEIERLESLLDRACGVISATETWADKHPMEVLPYLEKLLKARPKAE